MPVGWSHTKSGAKAEAKRMRKKGYTSSIRKLKKMHGQTHYGIYSYKKK